MNKVPDKIIKQAADQKKEFYDFLRMNNVSQLTIGVILGSAGKDLVTSLSNNIIMPLVGLLTPNGSWRDIAISIGNSQLKIGNAMASLLDFIIIALIVFVVIKKILNLPIEQAKTTVKLPEDEK